MRGWTSNCLRVRKPSGSCRRSPLKAALTTSLRQSAYDSELNVEALRHSFQAVLDRHPALRTTFKVVQGEPVQCVRAYAEVNFSLIEASTWDDHYLKEKLEEAAQQTFNLSEGPLHRITLHTRSASEHTLLVVMHHIVTDFWSLAVLMNEASAFYDAEISKSPVSLPEPPISYADYIKWQEEMLAGDEGRRLWEYWEKQLATAPAMLALPTDRPRSRFKDLPERLRTLSWILSLCAA